MNANRYRYKLRPDFAPETEFPVRLVQSAWGRGAMEVELDALKERLACAELDRTVETDSGLRIRRVANEAAALAWATPVPLLVLPLLFEELSRKARLQNREQERILVRSEELLETV